VNALGMPLAMVELVEVAGFTRNFVVADFCLRIDLDSLGLHQALLPENLDSCVLVVSP